MDRIGIRELRQNASEYIRRAAQGETIEVTDRGRPVARLSPLPKAESVLDRLIAEGKATAAKGDLRAAVKSLKPAAPIPGQPWISQILDELREERLP
ncbi:MAG: type II toxin-antitoxin system prevent-host-death family antitoxin [Chloroflexota bacterium]